jgi:hypothetical protein
MNNKEAAQLLKAYNAWRRRDEDEYVPIPANTKDLGIAIDKAIMALEYSCKSTELLNELISYFTNDEEKIVPSYLIGNIEYHLMKKKRRKLDEENIS